MRANSQSARAPTNKGNERVAAILRAARSIVVKEGFAGLSYRNIAVTAGIAVGNVNYYYPSKDELMVDLANDIFDRWDRRFKEAVPSSLHSPRAVFMYSAKFMIEQNKRDRTVSLLMEMWALANHSTAMSKMLDAFYGKMRAWIKEMILRAKPKLDPAQVELRSALITAQIEGLMILIGPNRVPRVELKGIEEAALKQIERLAFG